MNRTGKFFFFVLFCFLFFLPGIQTEGKDPGLSKGQKVLARWEFLKDLYYYPATIQEILGEEVEVNYDDGTKARIPRVAIYPRFFEGGDFAETPDGPGQIEKIEENKITVKLFSLSSKTYNSSDIKTLLPLSNGFSSKPTIASLKEKDSVLAKWDVSGWYAGKVKKKVGGALLIQFEDGSEKWVPLDLARPLDLAVGSVVCGINPKDEQPVPGYLVKLESKEVTIRFFDGALRKMPLTRLVVLADQKGIDIDDPYRDKYPLKFKDQDPRKKLASWLTKEYHFYDDTAHRSPVKTSLEKVEIALVLFLPKDRNAKPDWKDTFQALARQIEKFLKKELPLSIQVRVVEEPVKGDQTLSGYKKNLKESAAWHIWAPTGLSVKKAFPQGIQKGMHRVVVVLPDTPGLSADDSGIEKGMGFVRMKGEWAGGMSSSGVKSIDSQVPKTFFDEWKADYLATTIAHEILHTFGLPHTDGEPWAVMNIGPWYPIGRPEIHISPLHKLVMRSPFLHSQSLSQGFAHYLLDSDRKYFATVKETFSVDAELRLLYARSSGFFQLDPLLKSFAPKSRCRSGDRMYTGERAICRAYLAAFIEFVLEVYGDNFLEKCTSFQDNKGLSGIAKILKEDESDLESKWQKWLKNKVK